MNKYCLTSRHLFLLCVKALFVFYEVIRSAQLNKRPHTQDLRQAATVTSDTVTTAAQSSRENHRAAPRPPVAEAVPSTSSSCNLPESPQDMQLAGQANTDVQEVEERPVKKQAVSLFPRQPTDCTNRLPKGWKDNMLPADQRWIGKALFSSQKGSFSSQLTNWWYPPPLMTDDGKHPKVDTPVDVVDRFPLPSLQ